MAQGPILSANKGVSTSGQKAYTEGKVASLLLTYSGEMKIDDNRIYRMAEMAYLQSLWQSMQMAALEERASSKYTLPEIR